MRLPTHVRDREPPSLAMTPMIDVVFLLLIFFICTASFQLIEYALPTAAEVQAGTGVDSPFEPPEELERVVIKGASQGGATSWSVNDQPAGSFAEIRALLVELASIDSALPVIIDIEGPAPLGDAIDAYDVARLAGFSEVKFAAEAP